MFYLNAYIHFLQIQTLWKTPHNMKRVISNYDFASITDERFDDAMASTGF